MGKPEEKKDITLELSSKDPIYNQIRDFNFNHCRFFLPNKLEEIQQIREQKDKQSTLKELHDFLEKYKKVKDEYQYVSTRKIK